MNVLNRINLILAAMGSKPYTIKELSLEDVLHAGNYSIGIKCLIKNLRKSVELKEPTSMNLLVDVHDISSGLLYRASSDKGINPFLFTPGERIAEGSSNVYTRLISDILPSWRNAPQRNKSVICTNDFSGAEYYIDYSTRRKGTIYVVIPPNDARLVIAPTKDIWSSFKDLGSLYVVDDSILVFLAFFYYIIDNKLVDDILIKSNKTLEQLRDVPKIYVDIVKEMFLKDRSVIINLLDETDKILSIDGLANIILPIYRIYPGNFLLAEIGELIIKQKALNKNIHIINILDKMFDPKKNGFRITTYSSYVKKPSSNNEIWTEQPCIFININDKSFLIELYGKFTGSDK